MKNVQHITSYLGSLDVQSLLTTAPVMNLTRSSSYSLAIVDTHLDDPLADDIRLRLTHIVFATRHC